MARKTHVEVLRQGRAAWNAWRKANPRVRPDLRSIYIDDDDALDLTGFDLSGANLEKACFQEVTLVDCNLRHARLWKAIFGGSRLVGADLSDSNCSDATFNYSDLTNASLVNSSLHGAELWHTVLRSANLTNADLGWSDLTDADLTGATVEGANLEFAKIVHVTIENASFVRCTLFGAAIWGLVGEPREQRELIITEEARIDDDTGTFAEDDVRITTDNLSVAPFIYLLLNSRRIRDFVDEVSSKLVLILGSFLEERKAILDVLREQLRRMNYVAVIVDFPSPKHRDITETVRVLAHLSRFVIADVSRPWGENVAHELMAIIPAVAVPIQPVFRAIVGGEYTLLADQQKYPWVMEALSYEEGEELTDKLAARIVGPLEDRVRKLRERR